MKKLEYLTFTKVAGSVISYKFDVQTSLYSSAGNHEFVLQVGLANYPTATVAKVPFSIMIAPCIVTQYVEPSDYIWKYDVGKTPSIYMFNFV